MRGSSSQKHSRSFPETSALLPIETNEEKPSERAVAMLMTASPRAPDCDMKATRPSGGYAWANVPFILTSGSVLMTPMQFGPTSRIPWARHSSTSSA